MFLTQNGPAFNHITAVTQVALSSHRQKVKISTLVPKVPDSAHEVVEVLHGGDVVVKGFKFHIRIYFPAGGHSS